MKLAVCSDVHLEFGDLDLHNTENADVLILSGDIMVAKDLIMLEDKAEAAWLVPTTSHIRSKLYYGFIERCAARFKHVIMVAGNHEHYHGDFSESLAIMKKTFSGFSNVYVLDKETKEIDGMTFVGGTLWTDMNKEDPMTINAVKGMMNDFKCVTNGVTQRKVPLYKKDASGKYLFNDTMTGYIPDGFKYKEEPARFTPLHALEDHKQFLQYLKIVLENNGSKPVVVVGHHAPSKFSTHPRYKNEYLMNGAYSSDLSEFILDHPQIKVWTHGHTHEPFDYRIGSTRIVCNPRGYIEYEDRADNFELMFLDV